MSALLLSGCSSSVADPDTEDRQSRKMATDSERITAVIESHLAALRTGSVDDAAASTCAKKQAPAAEGVMPAITLGAVEDTTVRVRRHRRRCAVTPLPTLMPALMPLTVQW